MPHNIDQILDGCICKLDAKLEQSSKEQDYYYYYMCLAFRDVKESFFYLKWQLHSIFHPNGLHEKNNKS